MTKAHPGPHGARAPRRRLSGPGTSLPPGSLFLPTSVGGCLTVHCSRCLIRNERHVWLAYADRMACFRTWHWQHRHRALLCHGLVRLRSNPPRALLGFLRDFVCWHFSQMSDMYTYRSCRLLSTSAVGRYIPGRLFLPLLWGLSQWPIG